MEPDVELRIVEESRSGRATRAMNEPVVNLDGLLAMRAAAAAVDIPTDVRRFVVETTAAIRADENVVIGPSTIAAVAVVKAAAAIAAAHGRRSASIDDVASVLVPVLDHRLLLRSPADGAGRELIERTISRADERG